MDPVSKLIHYELTDKLDALYEACGDLSQRTKTAELDPLIAGVCKAYHACQAAIDDQDAAIEAYKNHPDKEPAKLCGKAGQRI